MNTTSPPVEASSGPASSSDRPASAPDRQLLASVLANLTGASQETVRIGKFELGEVLGEGARGVVYESWDPDLERPIALKLLRRRHTDGDDPQAWRDAFREAKAMERITHPNVVHVHEVGIDHQQAWLAMERVRGSTLRKWQDEPGRAWRDALRTYVRVGRGLAEAHRRQVIHGDFKPDNVLVGLNGIPKVTDFGLAAVDDDDGLPGGTPEYMAPEQLQAGGRSPASDQFAFCVALFEAMAHGHPYSRWTMEQIASTLVARRDFTTPLAVRRTYCRDLLANVERGQIQWSRLPSDVPSGVRTALARGLSKDPALRFESIDALLDRLDLDAIAKRRERIGWLSVGAVSFVAVGMLAGYQLQLASGARSVLTLDACLARVSQFDEVWNEDRRALLEERVPAAAGQVGAALERYRDEWRNAHVTMCERAVARAVPPDWESTCLEDRRQLVDEYFRSLDGNPAPLSTIGTLLNESPIYCLLDDPDRDEAGSEDEQATARRIRELLRGAFVDEGALRYEDGLQKAEQALVQAEALGFAPLIAEAYYQRGRLRAQHTLYVDRSPNDLLLDPMSDLHDAIVIAAVSEHRSVLVDAAIFRAKTLTVAGLDPTPLSLTKLGLHEEDAKRVMMAQRAEILEQHGLAAYHRALASSSDAPRLLAEALDAYEEALVLRESDGDALGRAKLLENIVSAKLEQGNARGAEPLVMEAIRFWRRHEPTRNNLPHLYVMHIGIVMQLDLERAPALASEYLAAFSGDDESELVILQPSILCNWGSDGAVELADRAMVLLDRGTRIDPLHESQLRIFALGALIDGERARQRVARVEDAVRWADELQTRLLTARAPALRADHIVMGWAYIGRAYLLASRPRLAVETLAPWMTHLHETDSRIASQLAMDLAEALLELGHRDRTHRALASAAQWVVRTRLDPSMDHQTIEQLEGRLTALAREAEH